MSSAYNWVKILHIFFVIAWMVGIFYLPRIILQYREASRLGETLERLKLMARKLYRFMTIMAALAISMGLLLWLYFGMSGGWMHAKLMLVLLLVAYHHLCGRFLRQMKEDSLKPDVRFLRFFSEAPTLLLLVIIFLTIAKPF